MEDTVSFLRYCHPEIPISVWKYDTLIPADRFQIVKLHRDYILNFMHAAPKNARIPLLHETCNIFKAHTRRILNY